MRSTLQILAAICAACLLVGAGSGCAPRGAATAGGAVTVPDRLGDRIDAREAQGYLAQHPEALLLDVREPGEWNDDLGHIDGAHLVPLGELEQRLGELDGWKDKPVITVCRVGARSATAARMLRERGFAQVANLSGGMAAWRAAGL